MALPDLDIRVYAAFYAYPEAFFKLRNASHRYWAMARNPSGGYAAKPGEHWRKALKEFREVVPLDYGAYISKMVETCWDEVDRNEEHLKP